MTTPVVQVVETWKILDQWWKPRDEWVEREFAAVKWYERELVFLRETPNTTWRLYKPKKE